MSELSTQPVLKCLRCGALYTIAYLSTAEADPDGTKLNRLMKNVAKTGLCHTCIQAKQWYIDQGRLPDFEAGRP